MDFVKDVASLQKRLTKMERSAVNLSLDYGFITTVQGLNIKVAFPKDGGKYESDWLLPCTLPGIIPSKPTPGMTAVCLIVGNQGVWLGVIVNDVNPDVGNMDMTGTKYTSEMQSTYTWKVPGQEMVLNSAGLFINGLRVRTI